MKKKTKAPRPIAIDNNAITMTVKGGGAVYLSSWSTYELWYDHKARRWREKFASGKYKPPKRIV